MSEPQPLNVRSFSAACDGATDDTIAINRALAVGKAQCQPVLIPAGKCVYSDILTADGVQLVGEGDESVLHATNPDRAAIFLRGTGAAVRNLKLAGVKPTVRSSKYEANRIAVVSASTFEIIDVCIEGSNGAAIAVHQSTVGRIERNRISGTLADSIHMTNKSSYIDVLDNVISQSGDDGIAVVSYQPQGGMVHHITARGNRISDSVKGRVMSVVGGSDILYENNMLSNNAHAAGMYFAQENSWNTYGVHNLIARHNTIRNCGNAAIGHFAIMLFSGGKDPNTNIKLSRNLISQDDARGGIRVFSNYNTDVTLDQNVVVATPPLQIVSLGVVQNPYVSGPVGVQM